MYELMAEFKPVFVMELPNSQSEKGLEFWRREVIRTKEYFEEFFELQNNHPMLQEQREFVSGLIGKLKENEL